jgi:hypothetical protein
MGRISPHPGTFLRVATKDLEHTELGRMYGKMEDEERAFPPPPVFS